MSRLIHVTDENFEAEILNSELPVVVDFSAEWCGPCKQLKPIVEELAEDFAGKVKVAHVDVDQAREHAQKFGIMSVPTVLFMKDGRVAQTQIGTAPKAKMTETINSLL